MAKEKNVMRASVGVMIIMLLSKLLGFVRQSMVASVYGSTLQTDIYFTSSDFLIGISGAFTAALTTALVSNYILIKTRRGQKEADRVASKVLTMFLMFSAVIIGLILLLAPLLAKVLAPGYQGEQIALLAKYLRIYSITFIFAAIESILAAVLNANDSFIPGKLYGLMYNPVAIVFMMLLSGKFGIDALVFAFVLGNVIQLLVLGWFCRKTFRFRVCLPFGDSEVNKVVLLSLPLLLSNVLVQCNNVVDKIICNLLGEGTVSAYSYAYTLEQFVTAVLTATVSLVLYSRFATFVAQKDTEQMERSFEKSISSLLLILVPVAIISVIGSGDVVKTVYMRGNFTADSATITQMALVGFAVGFPIVAVREMYIKAHFAYQDTKSPMVASILTVFLNMGLSVAFSIAFSRFAPKFGVLGVSLATSLSALLTIVLLHKELKKYLPEFQFRRFMGFLLKLSAASVACGLSAWAMKMIGTEQITLGYLPRFIATAAVGFIAYLAVLLILRCEQLKDVWKEIKTALYRVK